MLLAFEHSDGHTTKSGTYASAQVTFGWGRGSVVKTLVFGCRTFPDLCPIYSMIDR